MKILVCGGRDFSDRELFNKTLDEIHGGDEKRNITTIIHGGARGADSMSWSWVLSRNHGCCDEKQLSCLQFPADWKTHGKKAGMLRNIKMLEVGKPDLVVAFPGGKGTAHMVKIAKEAGIKVIEVSRETSSN